MSAKTVNINVAITESDYEELKSFAQFQGESITEMILDSIRERIELWEDIRDIKARENEPTSTWEEVQRRLNLL